MIYIYKSIRTPIVKFIIISFIISILTVKINIQYIQASNCNANLLDVMFLILSGPNIKEQNIFIDSQWLLIQFVFLYLFADISFCAFFKKGSLILFRVGSRAKLWLMIIVEIVLKVLLFLAIQFLTIIFFGIFSFPIKFTHNILATSKLTRINTDNLYIVSWMLLLLFLTYIVFALIQNTISLILKSSVSGILFCCMLQFFTLNSGRINKGLMKWLPGNQSIIVRHSIINPSVVNFNMSWSVFYNLFFIIGLILIGFLYTNKLDVI